MPKRRSYFPGNFTIFFSNAGKLGTCRNLNLINSRGKSFGDNFYIVRTSALGFKQLYIFYASYLIKRICLSEKIPYLA